MYTSGITVGISVTAILLYLRFRSLGHPVQPGTPMVRRRVAEQNAQEMAETLLSLKLTGWRTFSDLVRDDDSLDALTATGCYSAEIDSLVERWGLSGEWRIQLVAPSGSENATILVGLNAHNELTLFNAESIPNRRKMIALNQSIDQLAALRQLAGADSHWEHVQQAGEAVDRSSGTEMIRTHVRDSATPIAVAATVTSVEGVIQQIDRTVHVEESATVVHRKRQAQQDLLGTGALIISVAALIGGVIILTTSEVKPDLTLATVLAFTVFGCNLLNDALSTKSSVVGVYDRSIPLHLFRLISVGTMVLMSIIYSTVVFVSTGAGISLASDTNDYFVPDSLLGQAFTGVVVGVIWLAFSACYGAAVENIGLCRLARNPNGNFIRRSGAPWTRAFIGAAVSAISEETVFRFLTLFLVFNLVGSEWVAVSFTAVLWALMHSGQVTEPPVYRVLELTIVGVALGWLVFEFGLVAAVVAHFVFNAVVLRSHSHARPKGQSR